MSTPPADNDVPADNAPPDPPTPATEPPPSPAAAAEPPPPPADHPAATPAEPATEQRAEPQVPPAATVAEAPARKRRNRLIAAAAGVLILVVALIFGIFMLRGDRTKDARSGDCIASDEDVSREDTTRTGARIVACDSAEAQFTVMGRVDGRTDLTGESCKQFFTKPDQRYFVYASDTDGGYVLCLQATGR